MERQMTDLDKSSYLEKMRNKIIEPEVIELIESDLKSGLTDKEINDYATRGLNIKQMRAVSDMYHKNFPINVIAKIGALNVDAEKMRVAMELYENNVAIKDIETAISGSRTAHDMRAVFSNVLKKVQNVLAVTAEDVNENRTDFNGEYPEYINELIEQMKDIVQKINYQDERYDVLNEKLKEFEIEKKNDEVEKNLILLNEKLERENKELSDLLLGKQSEIAKGLQTLSTLRSKAENDKEEMKKLQELIDGLRKENAELKEKINNKMQLQDVVENKPPIVQGSSIPVYYAVPHEKDNKILKSPDIEYMGRKKSLFGYFIGRLALKKKYQKNLMELVINNELSPEQINEISAGLKEGLYEEQLQLIINKALSPERIKSIVRFAVLQNNLKAGKDGYK